MNKKTYLVTGGLGFMGSWMIKTILDKEPNAFIINIDKMTYASNPKNLEGIDEKHCLTIEADINDSALIRSVLETHRPDSVIHFAAETHVDNSIDAPMIFTETNVAGTAVLLSECRKYYEGLEGEQKDNFKYLQISTDEVYGALGRDDPKFNEDTPYKPHSPYSASKAGADHLAQSYYDTYGFPTIITHSCNNYGQNQHYEKLIPKVISNIILEKSIPIYGDGQQVRDWLYVQDHCEAVYTILHKGKIGEVYVIGANEEHSNIEVVELICELCDDTIENKRILSRNLIEFVEDRLGHDFRYAVDASKLRNELGWQPKVSFNEGMVKTVLWYLRNHSQILEMEMKNK